MAFIPYYGGDKIRYKISYGGNSAEVMGTYTLPINQWVHLALVQSGDICKIYADGVEIASGTVTLKPSGLGKTTANYLIKSQWPGDPFLNASMDEFRIYNRALDATEINGLMNATSLAVDNFSNTTAFDVVRAFPNPTSGQFDVILPTNEDSVTIGIYTLGAKLISKANYPVVDGKVHLNIDKEATGVYLIKIQSYPDKTIRIIKK
ncbi:MAG: hypothetical protein C0412_17100 [Flavobacterium sp.]|nr:hypothetical protein [Flavobacterium sp.]